MREIEKIRKLLEAGSGGAIEKPREVVLGERTIGVPPKVEADDEKPGNTVPVSDVMRELQPSRDLFTRPSKKGANRRTEKLWDKFLRLYGKLSMMAWRGQINAIRTGGKIDLARLFRDIYGMEPPEDHREEPDFSVVMDEKYEDLIRNRSYYLGRGYGAPKSKVRAKRHTPEYEDLASALQMAVSALSEGGPDPVEALETLLVAYHKFASRAPVLPKVPM